ncbi:MAG: rhomboid family intramembrane serine protease [Planctomycetaceae bacterium]|nr:rhomboid family intramembrane serine protease [Planctomycetaceae bacterium]
MVLPLGDLQRTRITPVVTYTLIAINVVVYLLQVQSGDRITMAFACTPWEVTHNQDIDAPVRRPAVVVRIHDPRDPTGRRIIEREIMPPVIPHQPTPIPVWLTLLTAMFLHGSPMHLIGNMLYLWIVGDNVEEVLGSVRYIIVYLACGLVGSLAQIAASPDSVIPTLGASGAIAGIMGAYVIWFPHHQIRVLVFRFITVLPAVVVIGGWIILQIWLGAGSIHKMGESGGVAYLAHVGGAVTGILVAFLFHDRAQYVKNRALHERGWTMRPPYGYG